MKKGWMLKGVLFIIAATAAMAAVVMWLWNWLMPDLFHASPITFIQALGLMLLCRILFRGFIGWKGSRQYFANRKEWKEKWEKMSPDEKEKMRSLWKQRCKSFTCESSNPESRADQAGV